MNRQTPVGALARGLVAGAVGTALLDAFQYALYRRGGGESGVWEWESSAGLSDWEDAPAPAHIGKRIVEGVFDVKLPPTRARLVNNVMHWGYGIVNGGQYGLLAGSLSAPRLRDGLPFGASIWASSYVILPAAKLYEPIWKYDLKTLANDLSGHLIYGLGTAATMQLLSR